MSDLRLIGDSLRQPQLLQGGVRPQERGAPAVAPGVRPPGAPAGAEGSGEAKGSGFSASLGDALRQVGSLQDEAHDKSDALALGEPVEVHDLMLAIGKSEVAFNLMLEIRNKLVDAWQTLSRSVV